MLDSPQKLRPSKQGKTPKSSKSKTCQSSHPTSQKLVSDSLSVKTTEKTMPVQSSLTPTTTSPQGSSIFSSINSPSSLPFKLDQIITQSKSEIEASYKSAESVSEFKKALSGTFETLRLVISENFHSSTPSRLLIKSSTPEVRNLMHDFTKPSGLTENVQRDLEQKLLLLSDYEQKIKDLTKDLESEKGKNSELGFKVTKLEIELDALLNTNYGIHSSLENNTRKDIRDGMSVTGSFILPQKQSILSKRHSSFLPIRIENNESSSLLLNLLEENKELKKNLELFIRNYDSLCGKLNKEREDFQRVKDLEERNRVSNEFRVRDLFFDLYFRVFKEENNKTRINTQFTLNPEHFFNEVLSKYEKNRELFEVSSFLLEKSQQENRNLLSKLKTDKESADIQEKDLRVQLENELAASRKEAARLKQKKRTLKQRLKETAYSFQVKSLETQNLNKELMMSLQARQEYEKKSIKAGLEQENELKSVKIEELSAELSQRTSELEEARLRLSNLSKARAEQEREYLTCRELAESKQSSLQTLLEESQDKLKQVQLELKIKETESKGLESKLMTQTSINDKQKQGFSLMKSEIIKKYEEMLEENEKKNIETQYLNESLTGKVDSLQKTILLLEAREQDLDGGLEQEINDSKQRLDSISFKLSGKIGESFIEPPSDLKDSVRTLESFCLILISQLDSAKNQVKFLQNDLAKIQEDLSDSQIALQDLSLKVLIFERQAKSFENDTLLLKEKYSSRRSSLVSVENQLKEKELTHLQAIQSFREKFNRKKEKLREKIRSKEAEINELKQKNDSRISEQVLLMQDREKKLNALCEDQKTQLNSLNEELLKLKTQKKADGKTIEKQNKTISKLEKLNEDLDKTEKDLRAEKGRVLEESNKRIRELQESLNSLQKGRENDESLEADENEYGEEHVSKMFKLVQEKETALKKANKKIIELQWAHRDVIEQCKEHEEKYLSEHEIAEKLTEENDKLNKNLVLLNGKIAGFEKSQEEMREKLKQFRESEIAFKKIEENLRGKTEELKIKCENYEDEISGLQLEITEFQKVLKSYAEENSGLSVSNRRFLEKTKKSKEESDDILKENLLLSSQVSKLKQEILSRESFFEIERSNFEKAREVLESQNVSLESQVSAFRAKLEDDEKIKKINEEIEKFREQRKSLRKNTAESLEKVEIVEQLRDQLDEKSQELLKAQGLCSDLRREIRDLKRDFDIKEISFSEKTLKQSQDLLTANKSLKSLETEKRNLDKKVSDLAKELEKAKSEIYDKQSQIKHLVHEKELMNRYVRGRLDGENLEELIKVKECFDRLEKRFKGLQEELGIKEEYYEEIVEGLRKQIELFKKDRKASSKSMWTHVDQLTKQLEEKNRLLMERDLKKT